MGSGKTTFGRQLAHDLGFEFIDLDHHIVHSEGCSVNEIFQKGGEKEFRRLETHYLKEVINSDIDVVLSLGGGTPCQDQNWEYISKSKSIYLKRTPLFLFRNLKNRKAKRPLIKDLSDEELDQFIKHKLEERNPFYSRAEVIFHAYGSKKSIQNRLLMAIRKV